MAATIHGIIQRLDAGHKIVEVVISRGDPKDKTLVRLDDDLPVNQGTITAGLRKKVPGLDAVEYRPRVRCVDLRQEAVK